MLHEEWVALGLIEQWRSVVSSVIFKQACSVVLEELYQFRTTGNTEVNALQNQFKEGNYSAIASLRALADSPRERAKIPKPWEHATKVEESKTLPEGPKR